VNVRRVFLIVFVFLLLIGIVLAFSSVSVRKEALVNQQQVICQKNSLAVVLPLESNTIQCSVEAGGWVQASATSKSPLTVDLLLSKLPTGNGTAIVHFTSPSGCNAPVNATKAATTTTTTTTTSIGCGFVSDLPAISNGTITLKVTNPTGHSVSIQEALGSSVQVLALDSYSKPGYAYRIYGVGLALVGGATLLFVVWDPRRLASRAFESLSHTG
jgi:hypothetical protein